MQAVPRFVSTDAEGKDPREFLTEAIPDADLLGSLIFLKGYQWPFDARKARSGSSIIDLAVYRETVMRGRRVFLDFRSNPTGYNPSTLSAEARDYLEASGALDLPTPISRLRAMNEPAYQFYRERGNGLDLAETMLEIAVCAQHNNGGLAGDMWWQSTIRGLFPVGEAAGAHGVYRPGGAALNSGQVGAMRAATWISHHRSEPVDEDTFLRAAMPHVRHVQAMVSTAEAGFHQSGIDQTQALLSKATRRMSDAAGLVRTSHDIEAARAWAHDQVAAFDEHPPSVDPSSRRSLDRLFLLRDILSSQFVYLSAMSDYLAHGGKSRGSVLYTDDSGDLPALDGHEIDLPETFRFLTDDGDLDDVIQETTWDGVNAPVFSWRTRRPIPHDDAPFEMVWKAFRLANDADNERPFDTPRDRT